VGLDSKAPSKGSQKVAEALRLHHMIGDVDIFYLVVHGDPSAFED
jgi:hypothetical protein